MNTITVIIVFFLGIGVYQIGMGVYEICKAISAKIRKKALTEEIINFSNNNLIKAGFKITIEKGDKL